MLKRFFLFGLFLCLLASGVFAVTYIDWDTPSMTYSGGGPSNLHYAFQYNTTKTGLIARVIARVSTTDSQRIGIWLDNGADALDGIIGYSDANSCSVLSYCTFDFSSPIDLNSGQKYWIGGSAIAGQTGIKEAGTVSGITQQTKKLSIDGSIYSLYGDMNVYSIPSTGITADFSYNVDKANAELDLNDLTTNNYDVNKVTINDWNWYVDTVSTGEPDQNISFAVTENTDYNVALSVCGTFGGNTYCDYKEQIINTGKFFGDTNFWFYDEDTGLPLSVDLDFNGTTYTGNSFWLPSKQITNDANNNVQRTFTVSQTGYGTRYYVVDMNRFSDVNVGFLLLPSSMGGSVPMKVYQTDETTLFTNTYVELIKPDVGGLTAGRFKTNANGEGTVFLSLTDSNYSAIINNGEFTYTPVALTVLYPKDELTLTQITEDWKIEITQNLFVLYEDLNADKIVYLLPNTSLPFNIKIQDMNSNYLSRTYNVQYLGNPLTDTLQPYLVPLAEGLLTTIYTKNSTTNVSLPNIEIRVFKNIPALGKTLVEQVLTDSKGQALTLLIAGADYEFETYYNGDFVKTFNITATSTSIYILLSITENIPSVSPNAYNVNFIPTGTGLIYSNLGTTNFSQIAYNYGGLNTTYTSTIEVNDVILSTKTYTGTDSTYTFTHTINKSDLNSGTVVSKIIVDGGTPFTFTQTYFLTSSFDTNYDIIQGLKTGLRSDLECGETGVCFPLLVIALIIGIAVVVTTGILSGQFGTQSSIMVFTILMIIFGYLTWVPIELTVMVVLIALAFMLIERRS